jgi:hypothetical protein
LFEAAHSSEEGVTFAQEVLLAFFTFLRSYAKSKASMAMKLASSVIDRKFSGVYYKLISQSSRTAVICDT